MTDRAASEKRDLEKAEEQLTVVGPAVVDDPPPESSAQLEPEYVPDGGREAWTVVLGSSFALFASAGMINTYVSALNTEFLFSVVFLGTNEYIAFTDRRAHSRAIMRRRSYHHLRLRRYPSSDRSRFSSCIFWVHSLGEFSMRMGLLWVPLSLYQPMFSQSPNPRSSYLPAQSSLYSP